MIELTIEELILWVISVPLVAVGLYVFFTAVKRRRLLRQRKRQIITCRACGHLYQDLSREKTSICSDCGRQNERGESTRLG